ncbi:unnamed protein product [Colias eurytheme]|nr:unnamed protein product [Colias eurytheme]
MGLCISFDCGDCERNRRLLLTTNHLCILRLRREVIRDILLRDKPYKLYLDIYSHRLPLRHLIEIQMKCDPRIIPMEDL